MLHRNGHEEICQLVLKVNTKKAKEWEGGKIGDVIGKALKITAPVLGRNLQFSVAGTWQHTRRLSWSRS